MTADCFPNGCFFGNNFDVVEALQTFFKVFFLIVFTYTLNKQKELETSKEQIN